MKVMTIVPLVAEYGQVVLYTVIQLHTNKLHSLPCIVYTVLVSCTVQASHTASSCTMYIVHASQTVRNKQFQLMQK